MAGNLPLLGGDVDPVVLLTSSGLLGIGENIIWSCSYYYITKISVSYAQEKQQQHEIVTATLYANLATITHAAKFFGFLLMSIVFRITDIVEREEMEEGGAPEHLWSNQTYTNLSYDSNQTNNDVEEVKVCGLWYIVTSSSKVEVEHEVDADAHHVGFHDDLKMAFLVMFVLCHAVAIALICCLDSTEKQQKCYESDLLESTRDGVTKTLSLTRVTLNGKIQLIEDTDDDVGSDDYEEQFDIGLLQLLSLNIKAVLLIPFTIKYGMLAAFMVGVFNSAWIDCSLGMFTIIHSNCTFKTIRN